MKQPLSRIGRWIKRLRRTDYEPVLLTVLRAFTAGAAYVAASPARGLTSSFVAIFGSVLAFDMIIASTRPPVRQTDWQQLIARLLPRIVGTTITLLKGVAVGAVMGVAVIVGMPAMLGAVFTPGLSYMWALSTRNNISNFVAILSGLALFEQLSTLEAAGTVQILQVVFAAVVSSGGSTFLALMAGWIVGLLTGSIVRPMLSKPYRSLRSAAYDLPLEMRPFNEVLQIGQNNVIITARVARDAPLADVMLADSRLGERWDVTVLTIKRGSEEYIMPTGEVFFMPGDNVTLLTPRAHAEELREQFRRPRRSGRHQSGAL